MVWPIIKLVTQVLSSVVGKSVVEAWKHVSTEAGNKEIFQREVRKAWSRQVESRMQRKRWRADMADEPVGEQFSGKAADGKPRMFGEELLRKKLGDMRKARTNADPVSSSKKSSMHPSEAVKVLHLSEATEAEIKARYDKLMAANGEAGSSQYLHDKIIHARDVATDHLNRGTLKKHIKIKKDDIRPTDVEPPL